MDSGWEFWLLFFAAIVGEICGAIADAVGACASKLWSPV